MLILTAFAITSGTLFNFVCVDCDKKVQNASNWEAYSPADERFQVQFPADPEEKAEEIAVANKTLQYQEYKAEAKDTEYKVSYIDFPGIWKMVGSKKLLTKSFDALLDQEDGVEEVLHSELTNHHGNPSLNYHFKQAGKEVKGRLVIVGNTLYRLVVSYPKAVAEKIDSESFLNSFQAMG